MNTNQNTSGQSTAKDQNSGLNMESLSGMLGGLNIPEAVKKYGGSATKAIGNLSTTQKVVGGALLLLGATYLTRKSGTGWLKSVAGAASKAGKIRNKR